MVNIWKIGSAPALWGNKKTSRDKKKYIAIALSKGFVAIGYGFISENIKNLYENEKAEFEKKIKEYLERKSKGRIGKRTKEIYDFAINIKEGDVIILYYTHSKAFIGTVKEHKNDEIYYYVEKETEENLFGKNNEINRAPHRIDVNWGIKELNDEVYFEGVCLGKWQDTLHQFLEEDLKNIKDERLRKYLKNKLVG